LKKKKKKRAMLSVPMRTCCMSPSLKLKGSASIVAAASRRAFEIIYIPEVTDLHQEMHN
jgi:hypothetical protein